jgi:hypothetical protein
MSPPSTTGSNGRDSHGRFASGNKCARGNPQARRAARLRAELFRTVTPEDFSEVVAALVTQARTGDTAAVKLLLDRLLGPPVSLDILARIEALEAQTAQAERQREESNVA